jgi:hypothetical protein
MLGGYGGWNPGKRSEIIIFYSSIYHLVVVIYNSFVMQQFISHLGNTCILKSFMWKYVSMFCKLLMFTKPNLTQPNLG